MNAILYDLLNLIVTNEGKEDLENVAKALGITKRMALYYVDKLNDVLSTVDKTKLIYSNGQLSINKPSDVIIEKLLKNIPLNDYILDINERCEIILLMIGLSKNRITLEYLIEELQVSRSTILNDLLLVRNSLLEHKVELNNNITEGYYFEGDEFTIRYILFNNFHSKINPFIEAIKVKFLINECYQDNSSCMSKRWYCELEATLISCETKMGRYFSYYSISDIVFSLLIVYLRCKRTTINIQDDELFKDNYIYAANKLFLKMKEIGLEVDEQEIKYIQILLMSAKVFSIDEISKDDAILEVSNEILSSFKKITHIDFLSNYDIYRMFLLHARPMYFRAKYKIKMTSLLDQTLLKKDNKYSFITNNILDEIEVKYNLYFDDIERVYVALYLGSMDLAIKERKNQDEIILVCGFGVGTSIYLKQQLEKIVGNEFLFVACDVRNYEQKINSNTKLIISTLDNESLQNSENITIPIIHLPMIMTSKLRLQLFEWKSSLKNENMNFNQLLSIVEKSANIKNKDTLTNELIEYFTAVNTISMHSNENILNETMIQIFEEEMDFDNAVKTVGQCLIDEGCIDTPYLDDIIAITHQSGAYAECHPKVLLAHAKPTVHTHKFSVALGVFKKPVKLEQWDKEFNLIFVVSIVDGHSHVDALSRIIDVLSQDNNYQKIHLMSESYEIYRLFNEAVN